MSVGTWDQFTTDDLLASLTDAKKPAKQRAAKGIAKKLPTILDLLSEELRANSENEVEHSPSNIIPDDSAV